VAPLVWLAGILFLATGTLIVRYFLRSLFLRSSSLSLHDNKKHLKNEKYVFTDVGKDEHFELVLIEPL